MNKIIGVIKKHYQQFMFVLVAFLSLAVISFYYATGMSDRSLNNQVERTMAQANAEIEVLFTEADAVITSLAHTLTDYSRNHTDIDYAFLLEDWAVSLAKNLTYYNDFTGARAVIGGAFYSSQGYLLPAGYEITIEDWYTGASEQAGRTYRSVFYTDVFTGDTVITLSRALYDENNNIYAVIAIDIKKSSIDDILDHINIDGFGYGFLIDENNIYISHPAEGYIGGNVSEVTIKTDISSVRTFITSVEEGTPLTAHRYRDFDNTQSVLFTSVIVNDWTLGVTAPTDSVFAPLYDMTFVMIIMSLMLVLITGYFMTLLTFEKLRSEEENQNKSSFLAKMSHELRTPLNAVLGMSELILREDIPHNIYENAMSIKQASTNLISIINDILDYSKIESGKLEIVPIDYYFSSLVNDVVSIIRMRLTDKPIKLVVNIDSGVPNNLTGDEVRIRQVLINILSNAVKYTKEGSIALDIYGEIKEQNIYDFIIDVTDTGIGIKEEDIHKLFGDFVQINMAANKGVEGTGLGLVIARNICRAMGGDITVKSVYGKGSTFSIKFTQKFRDYEKFADVEKPNEKAVLLYEARNVYSASIAKTLKNLRVPYAVVHNQNQFYEELKKTNYPYIFVSSFLFSSAKNILEKLETEAKLVIIAEYGEVVSAKCDRIVEMPAHCVMIANVLNDIIIDTTARDNNDVGIRFIAPTAHVLIVDDIATNLKVAEGLMSPYGMKIDTAMSGAEAIERVKKTRYDVVFMDHMMPGMDGIEATERIRKIEDAEGYYKELPIIALTAVAISGVKEMFLQNGLNDFLAKPIEMAKLNIILDKWIPKEKQEKEITAQETAAEVNLEIEGIDVKVGLSMTGGTIETYMRVLSIFYNDCIEKMEEISRALAGNDLYLYTTYVHALKSASANVGATKVSEMAKQLESAGKNEDVMYIIENNDEFFLTVRELMENIKPVLEKLKEDEEDDSADIIDIEPINEKLTKLKTALDDMDISTIDILVDELQKLRLPGEMREAMENVFRAIILFEYGEAIERIDGLLGA